MSYREKIAWVSLIAMALPYGFYFTMVSLNAPVGQDLPNLPMLRLFVITALTHAIILGVGYVYLRKKSPQDARAPLDERDIAIKHRAIKSAYYVLIAGMILVGCIMPFTESGWSIVNPALLMIVISLVVCDSLIVYNYRKQA